MRLTQKAKNNMFRNSIEIEATIIEIDDDIYQLQEEINKLGPSGATFVNGEPMFICRNSEDRMGMVANLDQLQQMRLDLQNEWMYSVSAEHEAKRMKCSPEEVIALWEGRCSSIPDYDDHSSDDALCAQNILCEVGMHIETNPLELNELDL